MAQDQQARGIKRSRNSDSSSDDESIHRDYIAFFVQKCGKLYEAEKYCDVTLKVGNTKLKCHRFVLAANSDYFAGRFENHFQTENEVMTLSAKDNEFVDEKSLSKLVKMMYGEPFTVADDLIPLFTTSSYLGCTHFIARCRAYIEDNLERVDVLQLMDTPEVKADKSLCNLLKKQISRDFVALRQRLASIPFGCLKELLSDPDLFVTCKEELLDFGKTWLMHNLKGRMKHFRDVVSLLKPGHKFLPETERFIAHLESIISSADETDVAMALTSVLEYRPLIPKSSSAGTPVVDELFPTPLFLLQAHRDSAMVYGTYKDQAWDYWNEMTNKFFPPVDCREFKFREGAVASDTLYFMGCRGSRQSRTSQLEKDKNGSYVHFYGLDGYTRKWTELSSPHKMATCLASCNSKIYAYDGSAVRRGNDGYQLSVFESVMNRWFRVPAVNHPRVDAGIACSDNILYMVGGHSTIASPTVDTPSEESPNDNIFEFYDCRRGRWSVMNVQEATNYEIRRSHKCVCFINHTLYFRTEEELLGLDIRNNRVSSVISDNNAEVEEPVVSRTAFFVPFDRETIWSVGSDDLDIQVIPLDENATYSPDDCIEDPNEKLEYIVKPYR